MEDIIPKGTYLPHSYYAEGDGEEDESLLIPSWADGLFPSSDDELTFIDNVKSIDTIQQKRPRRHYESKNTQRRAISRRCNFERLVINEIRQCEVCACTVLWTPSTSHRYFGSTNGDQTKPPHYVSIACSLPHFIGHHIQSVSALPCSFCIRAYESCPEKRREPFSWCGTLFCSRECQIKGENDSFAVKTSSRTSNGHVKSPRSPFLTPKLFFCRNRISNEVESNKKEQDSGLMQDVLESLSALEQRLRSMCQAYRSDTDLHTQKVEMEECALIMATLICCSCPWWVNELLSFSSKINIVNQTVDNKTTASENELQGGKVDLEPSEECLVEEMWVMTRSHWSTMQSIRQPIPKSAGHENSSNETFLNEQSKNGDDTSKTIGSQFYNGAQSDAPFPSYYNFTRMYVFIKRHCLVRVSPAQHPLVAYATKTMISSGKMTDSDRKVALDAMQISFEETARSYGAIDCSADSKDVLADQGQHKNDISLLDVQSRIALWRKATHFAHFLSTGSHDQLDKEDQTRIHSLLRKSYYAFSPLSWSTLKHSCAPSMLMVTRDLNDKPASIDQVIQKKNTLSWLALHDIPMGEASISKIDDIDTDVNSRRKELKKLLGRSFVCTCERCQYECNTGSNKSSDVQTCVLTSRQFKRLGDLAMQQGRFEDATNIYQAILDLEPCNADAFHAKAASLLGRASSADYEKIGHCQGYFLEAQYMWNQAASNDIFAKHSDIHVQLEKQQAFGTIRDLQCNKDFDRQNTVRPQAPSIQHFEYDFSSYLNDKVFITNDNTPIISLSECQNVIQTAEDYAERKGWTTSRHYAVPTTDIPLHELKDLRTWFYNLWTSRVRPLLRLQFKLNVYAPSAKPRDIFIHDAFVVRYDAEGGQRSLPPHYDESTHSFVIALNTNFEGGGTFIHSLGKALKPGVVGGMVSFCGGGCLHSGDTVVQGVRYIIVAFCYVDLINGTREEKKKSEQSSKHEFSFGFSV